MIKARWWLLFTPSACLGVSLGVSPSLWECWGSGDGLGTLWGWRRLLWPRSRCEIGLQVPEAVFGERVGFVCSLPSCVERKSHFWQPAGHSGRTRSGRSVPGLEATLGSPCAGSWDQVPRLGCLCTPASPSGLCLCKVSVLWGSGLQALVTHGRESPVGWVVARLGLMALTELSLVLLARGAVIRTAS